MKYLVIVLFLLCSCNTEETKRKAYSEGFKAGYDKGRWNEKMRWTKFQSDSIQRPYLRLQIQVLLGEVDPEEAWRISGNLIMKTTDPFSKYK